MGFVGIGYHSHLLEGVEDIVFEHSIYIPFIEGRGIIFMLSKDNWFSGYGKVWGSECFGSVPCKFVEGKRLVWISNFIRRLPGLFCRVLTWFVEVEGLVVCGVSGTVKDKLSRCCKCVLIALRKSVWFSWSYVWLVFVIW